eukprot:10641470-Alexandrium_andersonii.AAC.1
MVLFFWISFGWFLVAGNDALLPAATPCCRERRLIAGTTPRRAKTERQQIIAWRRNDIVELWPSRV